VPRYASDLTDEQWAELEPLLPVKLCDTVLGGRSEKHDRRTMIGRRSSTWPITGSSGGRCGPISYQPAADRPRPVLRPVGEGRGSRRRHRPAAGQGQGQGPGAAGRDPEPSADIIDAQSVHESAEGVVPSATSGFDSHKKVRDRMRHLLTDTMGLLIAVAVTPAGTQDRTGAAVTL
jgi:hypothetical protein